VIHNTVANNDSTATAALAFLPGNLLQSIPQGAGNRDDAAPAAACRSHRPDVLRPGVVNNIIWQNRSFSWDATVATQGALIPAASSPVYWDLQVADRGPWRI